MNKTKTYFKDSDRQARSGTERIVSWLKADSHWVTNLEKIADFQDLDIDLYAYKHDVGPKWLELKVDSYSSGNLFLEIIGNDKKNTPGCIYKTRSSHIYYFFDSSSELLVLPTHSLQHWLRQNESRFRRVSVATTDDKGAVWYHTVGLLVSKAIVLQEVPGAEKLFLPAVC